MNYAKIIPCDVTNGEGYRVSLFISGSDSNYYNYYNENVKSFYNGRPFTETEIKEILTLLKLPNINGLSILGGDPLKEGLDDILKLNDLVNKVHCLEKNVWLWTSQKWEELYKRKEFAYNSILTGFTHEQRIDIARWNLVKTCDVVIDGQFIQSFEDKNLKYRSSSNQRIIDAKESNNNVMLKYI